jgi:type II secretory pathway pseudopilin PulG
MKKYNGFTLLEILLYVVIGGITLSIGAFSFIQITRLSTNFTVNSELNQNGKTIIEQIKNLINDSDYILNPKQNGVSSSNLTLIKNNVETNITQSGNNIVVSYSNGTNSFNLNPTGIIISNTPSPTLSFEQIATKDNNENIGLSQTIKVKFTLIYNKPTFGGFEYEAEKTFENTITMSKKTTSFQPILNTYPTGNNGVAYGLRKLAGLNTNTDQLSSAYSGPAIRVRRDRGLDQSEMDIGFNSKGELNKVALQNFVGYQNFINYSEDITATNWTLNNITTINNSTSAPDNAITAERINLSAGNNTKFLAENTNVISGTSYTDSYYIKANNGYNFVQIAPDTGFSASAYQNYNLSNGTLGSSFGVNTGQANIQAIGSSGWYRISLTATATSTTSGRMILAIISSVNSSRLAPINIATPTDSIFVWGGMRHLGSSLKPYQQTLADPNTGDGYVTTWYDQSGNKNNAIQITTGFQPKIVDGVNGIVTMNNKPVIQFDGNDDQLVSTSFNNSTTSTAFFIASRVSNSNSFMARLTNYAILGATDLFSAYYLNKSTSVANTGEDTKNSLNLYTAIRTSTINSTLAIGAGSTGNFLNGNIAELIIYDGNNVSNKVDIENNLRDYYGTP